MEKKDQIEFVRNVVQGLKDYKNGRDHSVSETFDALEKIIPEVEKRCSLFPLEAQ